MAFEYTSIQVLELYKIIKTINNIADIINIEKQHNIIFGSPLWIPSHRAVLLISSITFVSKQHPLQAVALLVDEVPADPPTVCHGVLLHTCGSIIQHVSAI